MNENRSAVPCDEFCSCKEGAPCAYARQVERQAALREQQQQPAGDGVLRWLDAQCEDESANPRFRELRALLRSLTAAGRGGEGEPFVGVVCPECNADYYASPKRAATPHRKDQGNGNDPRMDSYSG